MPLANGDRGNSRGNRINGRANKDDRRKAAFAREAESAGLSISDKLKKLPAEGASKQRARYTAALNKQAEKSSQTSELMTKARAMVDNGEAVSLSEAKRIITMKKQPEKA